MASQDNEVNRHADGSIDFDFYRARSAALRRQAMRDARLMCSPSSGLFTAAGAFTVLLIVFYLVAFMTPVGAPISQAVARPPNEALLR